MINKIRTARRHAIRTIAVAAVVPAVALGLCGSALADSDDYTTLAFNSNQTAAGYPNPAIIYAGYGFIGYSSSDTLTSSSFTVPTTTYQWVGGRPLRELKTSARLKFDLQMSGSHVSPATENMAVVVISGGNATLLATYDNSSAPTSATLETLDLSPWSNQQVQIEFEMQQPTTSNNNIFEFSNNDLNTTTTCVSQLRVNPTE